MIEFQESVLIRRHEEGATAFAAKSENALRDDDGGSREVRIFFLPGSASVRLGDEITYGGAAFTVAALRHCRSVDGRISYLRAEAVR
ncbi:MAG: hypothetical protein MJ016_06880 [Victivallaceae bacterium]|nr:hypothetical protein [Victivallaceae bacterium]